MMKFLVPGLLAVSLLVMSPERALAKCGDNPGDDAAVAATRAQVEVQCPCASFTNHGQYVKCSKGVINAAVDANTLPKQCKGTVKKCSAKSTCGKAGSVTCCRTNAKGVTKCSVKKDASKCKPPKNGSACVSVFSSCCDACSATGCNATPTPTPTPTPTAPPTATPSPTPPYGSASQAFIGQSSGLLQ